MLKLYFSSVPSIISTVSIVGFAVFFSMVNARRSNISHWGILVICLFFLGLFMSIMSGVKDNINTASAVFPAKGRAMTVLSVLGGLAFIAGILMLFIRRQNFWQTGFYILAAVIFAKIAIVEVYRIITYYRGAGKTALPVIVLAVIVLIAFVIVRYNIDMYSANKKMMGYRTMTTNTSYGRMTYTQAGEGEPVLIVHGICGGYDQGIDIGKSIFGEGYRLICPSRFGYPGTDLPEHSTPKDQAEAYKQLLDSLGIDKAIILGHSAGGGPSLRFAMQYPERVKALVLLSANVPVTDSRVYQNPPDFIYNDFPMWVMSGVMKSFFRSMFGVSKEMYDSASEIEKKGLDDVIVNTLPMSSRRAGILNDNRYTNPDTVVNRSEYGLEGIDVPVLFIQSKDDPMSLYKYVEAAQKRIAGSEMALFESGGHPIFGHTEELRMELGKFVAYLDK